MIAADMRGFALLLLLAAGASAQKPMLLVLEKGASELNFCTPEGENRAAVRVGLHPHEIVLSPDGRYAYTSDNGTMRIEHAGRGGNTISIIDLKERRKVGEVSLGRFRRPHGLALDAKTGRLAVTTELPDQLLLVDLNTRRVVRLYETKGKTSHMVSLSLDGTFAYVSNAGSGNVSVIDLNTGAVKLLRTGVRPEGSVRSRDGRHVYVCNRESETISIIDTATNQVTGFIRTGRGPVRIAETPEGNLVYAAMHDRTIELADPITRRVLKESPGLDGEPVSLNLSADGTQAYTSVEELDCVYTLAVPQMRVLRRFQLPKGTGPDPVLRFPVQ